MSDDRETDGVDGAAAPAPDRGPGPGPGPEPAATDEPDGDEETDAGTNARDGRDWRGTLGRRWYVPVVLAVLVAIPATPWVLIADVHSAPAWEPVDTDRPADAVMADVRTQLQRVDHRRVTRASLLQNGTRTRYAVYEAARAFSSYQYVTNYVRYGTSPSDTSLFGERFSTQISIDAPLHVVQYGDDALFALGYRFSTDADRIADPGVGNYTVDWNRTYPAGPNRSLRGLYRPYLDPRGGGWRLVERNESAVVLGIDDPGAVYRTVPMGAKTVHPGTRLRLVLDRATGRPERLIEHRLVTVEVDNRLTRRHYVLVTTFRDWRTVSLGPPAWVERQGLNNTVEDLLHY